jgi:hypothetical protein
VANPLGIRGVVDQRMPSFRSRMTYVTTAIAVGLDVTYAGIHGLDHGELLSCLLREVTFYPSSGDMPDGWHQVSTL